MEDIPALERAVEQGVLIDLGVRTSLWGGQDAAATCETANATARARRDYIMVTPDLHPAVCGYRVMDIGLPTHDAVRLILDAKAEGCRGV